MLTTLTKTNMTFLSNEEFQAENSNTLHNLEEGCVNTFQISLAPIPNSLEELLLINEERAEVIQAKLNLINN